MKLSVLCPTCGGIGKVNAVFASISPFQPQRCLTCNGKGWITGEKQRRIEVGERLRKAQLKMDF